MTATRRRTTFELFPLIWLIYLIFPLVSLTEHPRPISVYLAAAVGLAVFLWLYARTFSLFRGKFEEGGRWSLPGWGWCLLLYALSFPVLGGVSSTFLMYGASMAGFGLSGALAGWLTLVNVGAMAAPFLFGQYNVGDLGWLLPNFLIMLFAAYANHASYRRILADRRLRQVQLEKEKLAQTAERERIARDLHDLLGHTLSVIVLKSELAARLTERDPAGAAREIREVERISREALGEVRAAVRGYRGSGLGAELGRGKVALDAAGVTLEAELLYGGQLLDLPRPVEAVMEMVLREAITNVVRHSGARKVRVRVQKVGEAKTDGSKTDGHWELEVHDDGVGGAACEGSGLTGMRERVRALGGTLTRDGRGGTRVLARFPAAQPAFEDGADSSLRKANA